MIIDGVSGTAGAARIKDDGGGEAKGRLFSEDVLAGDDAFVFLSASDRFLDPADPATVIGWQFDAEALATSLDLMSAYLDIIDAVADQFAGATGYDVFALIDAIRGATAATAAERIPRLSPNRRARRPSSARGSASSVCALVERMRARWFERARHGNCCFSIPYRCRSSQAQSTAAHVTHALGRQWERSADILIETLFFHLCAFSVRWGTGRQRFTSRRACAPRRAWRCYATRTCRFPRREGHRCPGGKAWKVPIPGASRSGPPEYEVRVQRTGLEEIPLRSLADWLDIQQRLAQARPAVPLYQPTPPPETPG